MAIFPSEVNKILIIKLRGIGDVVLSTIIFNSLKKYFPNSEIDYLSDKPGSWAVESLDCINKVHIFDRGSTINRLKQIYDIRKEKYDLVIDLFTNPATALLTFFSGAKYKIGYPYDGRKYAYNIYGPKERDKHHAAELHLEVLKNAGIPIHLPEFMFGYTKNDIEIAENFYNKNCDRTKIICAISPSGGWASKKCPPKIFAKIAKKISNNYNVQFLIVWGPEDEEEALQINKELGSLSVIAPSTTLKQMGAFLKLSDCVIANDSGPMHISTAVGTPTFSIHGPTNPKLQGPYGDKHEYYLKEDLDCIICNLLECNKNQECFNNISLDNFIIKFDNFLKRNSLI